MNMQMRFLRDQGETRRGVALIVVLGFLSIMVVMAVAFITQARMERMVADVSMDAQRGRQMARTALNVAMSDYSYQLYDKKKFMLPPLDSDYELFLSKAGLASGEIQPSLPNDNGTLAGSGLEIMKGEARNWIPRRYLADEAYAMENTRWILVRRDPSKGEGKDNPIVGRYAYACFDMSGGIDANLVALTEGVANVGNATNRSSVRDVGLGELKEMQPIQGLADKPPDASLFKRLRRGWHGFDSLAELILLTNGRYNGGENSQAVKYNGAIYYYIDEGVSAEELPPSETWGPPKSGGPRWRSGEGWTRIEDHGQPALNSTNVSDLVPYSLASFRGWEYNANTATWKTNNLVAWDENPAWSPDEWEKALGELKKQFADEKIPDWWNNALNDYTNSLGYPQAFDYPSPKNVPMLNEVSMTVTPSLTDVQNQLRIDVALQIEWWFPFPSAENKRTESYTLAPTIGVGPSADGSADIWIPMRGAGNAFSVPQQVITPAPITFTAVSGVPKAAAALTYSALISVTMADAAAILSASNLVQIGFIGGEGIKISTGGQPVDWMPAQVLDFRTAAGPMLTMGTQYGPYYWEVHDPRLNHLEEGAWEQGSGTMGLINAAAKSQGYGTNGDSTNFYCRNAPMVSPVEVGYFNTGLPWKTVEFCTKEGADALSRMVTRKMIDDLSGVGVAYTNGTINPNTSSSNVLRSAFAGLRIKDSGSALDDAELSELVGIFGTITKSKTITDNSGSDSFSGACMRGVDWMWAKYFQPDGYYGKKWSKNERHRLIERTWGLFNPNNSMFTALVIGQVVKEGAKEPGKWSEDDVITGERRGVALVWRDPTPPGLGKPHEMFVRMFKFLDE